MAPHAITVHAGDQGPKSFVVASRRTRPGAELQLILAGYLQPTRRGSQKRSRTPDWDALFDLAQGLDALAPLEVRSSMSTAERAALTRHVLWVQQDEAKNTPTAHDGVVEATVAQWKDLVNWGEVSAAQVLALAWNVSPRTIHSRLRLARDSGIIDSPGQGKRQ